MTSRRSEASTSTGERERKRVESKMCGSTCLWFSSCPQTLCTRAHTTCRTTPLGSTALHAAVSANANVVGVRKSASPRASSLQNAQSVCSDACVNTHTSTHGVGRRARRERARLRRRKARREWLTRAAAHTPPHHRSTPTTSRRCRSCSTRAPTSRRGTRRAGGRRCTRRSIKGT